MEEESPQKSIWYHKWIFWPFTKNQVARWNKPAKMIVRMKIIAIFLYGIAIWGYFYGDREVALWVFGGATLGLLTSFWWYRQFKAGKFRADN